MEPQAVTDRLTRYWHRFADHSLQDYAPIYEQMVRFWADDAEIMALVAQAPPAAHGPNNLQAATHYLLLDHPGHALAKIYAGSNADHPGALARDLVLANREQVAELLATRTVQTNEVARTGAIAAGLGHIAAVMGQPLAVADVGSSGGLNLLFDRYRLEYISSDGTTIRGPADADVAIPVAWFGGPVPSSPEVIWRRGYDRSPIDLTDPEASRWLEALVWPDHPERVLRLRAAVAEARLDPPTVLMAEALDGLDAAIADAPAGALLTIVTSWVYFYFDAELRAAFDRKITEADRRVAWLALELGGIVAGVEPPEPPDADGEFSLVSSVIGGGQEETSRSALGWAHPHGTSIHWRIDNRDR